MSKRSREGDILIPCVTTNPLKRRQEWPDTSRKRQMLLAEAESFALEPARKRSADFETEICHLHKRLRATIPTAEEAISFLLPHMSRLRAVYVECKNDNNMLKEHVEALKIAYYKTKSESLKQVSECQQEIRSLRRQLEMAKYRLAMTDTTCKTTMFQ